MSEPVKVPDALADSIGRRIWPATLAEARSLSVDVDLVRALAPDEHGLYLEPPPFNYLEDDNLEWFEQFRHPGELDYATAIVIGDFGLGSDNPVVLDTEATPHRVMALAFGSTHPSGSALSPSPVSRLEAHWVELAPTLEAFVSAVGLLGASQATP